jgi:serine phosphatase RsbU (regulator of sigma subunit)/predicted enzyme related to lactoylglutathione lyase
MSRPPSLYGLDRTAVRPDSRDPDLRIFKVNVYVRDQQRSLEFYTGRLGFDVLADVRFESGERWVAVAPPNGSAVLALMAPKPESSEYALIGSSTAVAFMTEDIHSTYERWRGQGVVFNPPPTKVAWGALFAQFEDLDGNSFDLISSDEMSREIEEQRRTVMQKLEAERRVAQELEIAKEVQARLFPQTRPAMRTLDYAGTCIQARQVGGDYFDFLALGQDAQGHGRLGMVVGDVSGKGIAAALLMANLQANVRSQSAMAVDHPECMLASVNQLFYANSSDGSYATLFFAEYDESGRALRYANCGHLPGLLLRANGELVRLESTGTLLGIFGEWDCAMRECALEAGDTLLLYTDGVTESFNDAEEDFGEERLVSALRRYREGNAQELVESIVGEVRQFSAKEQFDDITVIAAKGREPARPGLA